MTDEYNWHELSANAVLTAVNTTSSGLGQEEAAKRQKLHGANRLPEPVKRSAFVRFVLHFHNILIYVLLGSAVVTLALDHFVDTFVILAVVLANVVTGVVAPRVRIRALTSSTSAAWRTNESAT